MKKDLHPEYFEEAKVCLGPSVDVNMKYVNMTFVEAMSGLQVVDAWFCVKMVAPTAFAPVLTDAKD